MKQWTRSDNTNILFGVLSLLYAAMLMMWNRNLYPIYPAAVKALSCAFGVLGFLFIIIAIIKTRESVIRR